MPTSSSTCARPAGDALVRLDGLDTPIGPGSTVANATIVNELKVQTAAILLAQGALPPVLTSGAVVGAERSAELFEAAYREHARRVARSLAGAAPEAGRGRELRRHESSVAVPIYHRHRASMTRRARC